MTQCMVRPRGARGFGRRWLMRSCVNVFGLRLEHVLLAIMDISAHAILLADRPRRAVRVTRVRTRREDRSSIVVSSSRRTRRVRWCYVIDSLLALRCSFVRAWRRPFLRPDLRMQKLRRAGTVKAGRRALPWPLAPAWPGQALTGPSPARGLSGLGRSFIGLDAREGVPLVKNRPGDAGELVGERDRQHVVV
jgi:hypothetical protein